MGQAGSGRGRPTVAWFEVTPGGDGLLDELAALALARLRPALARIAEADRQLLILAPHELAGQLGGEGQIRTAD
jgi:hypothetical protein